MKKKKDKKKENKFKKFIKTHKILTIIISVYLSITIVGLGTILIRNMDFTKSSDDDLCKVSFDAAGSAKPYIINVKCGKTIKTPYQPNKEGFDFIGWYLNDEPFDLTTNINGDIILKAKFKAKENIEIVKVTFDTNGGTYTEPIEIMKGTKINNPLDPILLGYTFEGWYLDNKKFDFKEIIDEDITLTAKWKKDENYKTSKNNQNNNGNINSDIVQTEVSSKYKCSGGYIKNGKEQNVSTNYSIHLNNLWYSGISYTPDYCNLVYTSSNEKTATISSDGMIQTKNIGTTNISACIVDIETNDEVGCFQAKLNVKGSKCEYRAETQAQNTHYEGLTNGETRSWSYGYYFSYNEGCDIYFKSSNTNVAKFNTKNEMVGTGVGTAILSECIKEKSTNKTLECYDVTVDVHENNENLEKKGRELLNSVKGYYWYLDGYEYAYVHVNIFEDRYVDWQSKFIEIENNRFVTSEESGVDYYSSSNIHNMFLADVDGAYRLIDDYNMKVVNNKLYITLGNKTYSFTKYTSEKSLDTQIQVSTSSIKTKIGESIEFDATVSPSIVEHKLYSSVYNGDVSCTDKKISNTKWKFTCMGISSGSNGYLYIVDSYTGASSYKIPINVEYKKIYATSMKLNKTEINMMVDQTETIKTTFEPTYANDKITWVSSNPNIATVSNGVVTGLRFGTITITATTETGLSEKVTVTVTKKPLEAEGNIISSSSCYGYNCVTNAYASVTASGGSGIYRYYLKVYEGDTLINELNYSSSASMQIPAKSGTYRLEYTVVDSDGETKSGSKTVTLNIE